MTAAPTLPGGLLVPAVRLPEDYGRLEGLTRLLVEDGVAGFVVYGGDAELTPPYLARLREVAERPLLLMADYERGAGQHVAGMPELPPAMAIGATGSAEAAYRAGKIAAVTARAVGIDVVLAPVLDVLSRPDNPIAGSRAFSDDPDLVTKLGLAFIEGVQEEGVLACAKHYPGHGDTERDSHLELPEVGASAEVLRERELVPFRAAARAGVGMIMTAHARYPAMDPVHPATFSRTIVTEVLKEGWAYGGLVISDALNMEGARRDGVDPAVAALAAGVDLLLYPPDPLATMRRIRDALEAGELTEGALLLSAAKAALAAGDRVFEAPAEKELSAATAFEMEQMARRSLTVGGDPDRLRARFAADPGVVCALILDDDGVPRRARTFDDRREEIRDVPLHVTREGTGYDGDVAARLREADTILMAIFGDVRAGKGRAGLSAELRGFASAVLSEHARKTLALVFGSPCLVMDLPVRNVVFAYGDTDVTRAAALHALFDGEEMPGRLPAAAGTGFPRGIGRGVFPEGG